MARGPSASDLALAASSRAAPASEYMAALLRSAHRTEALLASLVPVPAPEPKGKPAKGG